MLSLAIQSLTSLNWLPALKISNECPANFEALTTLYHQLSTFFFSDSAVSIPSFIMKSVVGTFLAITLSAWIFLHLEKKKKINKSSTRADIFEPDISEESSEGYIGGSMEEDASSRGTIVEMVTAADAAYVDKLTTDDADYAEALQFQEALVASIFASEIANNPSSSLQGPIFHTELVNLEKEAENSSHSFCEICLENKESWQMFTNDKCPHSFCYDCTTSHILAKIQDRVKEIVCPALNCNVVLNFDACRLMIPDDSLVQWDELLCMSLIPDSQKLYCPFRDCSALLVNDSEQVVTKIKCLVCKRSFCARCHVPWHSEFKCKEFLEVYAKKGGKGDKIVKLLAKKKSWQKCPKCNMYVEKSEGCVHITCWCKYEFCYICGSKWSDSHGGCRPRS